MKKITLTLCFVINFFFSYAQLNETIGMDMPGFRLSGISADQYSVTRVDQAGYILWIKPILNEDNTPFDFSHQAYCIYGFTTVKNGKITNNTADYDYWLIPNSDEVSINLFPNPSNRFISVGSNKLLEGFHIQIYNINSQLVFSQSLSGVLTVLDLGFLFRGVYLYQIVNNTTTLKTGKLCLQ